MAVRKFGWFDFRGMPVMPGYSIAIDNDGDTAAVVTSGAGQLNAYVTQAGPLYVGQLGAAVLVSPVANAAGMTLPVNAANGLGATIDTAIVSAANAPMCFTVGTDPAFWVQATYQLATAANNLFVGVGFHTAAAGTPDITQGDWTVANLIAASATPYADIAFAGHEAAACHVAFKTNSTAGTDTATTDTALANATAITMRVNVSATGVCTALRNGVAVTAGNPMGTLTSAIVVSPFFVFINAAASNTTCTLQSFGWGIQ